MPEYEIYYLLYHLYLWKVEGETRGGTKYSFILNLGFISLEHTPMNFLLVGYYLTVKVKRNVAQKGGLSQAEGKAVWGLVPKSHLQLLWGHIQSVMPVCINVWWRLQVRDSTVDRLDFFFFFLNNYNVITFHIRLLESVADILLSSHACADQYSSADQSRWMM